MIVFCITLLITWKVTELEDVEDDERPGSANSKEGKDVKNEGYETEGDYLTAVSVEFDI